MPTRSSASASSRRYRDVDGDGIPYRTVPGDGMPAYFTRGSGHNEKAQYSERADDYANNLDRLARKFETARTLVPKPEVDHGRRRRDRPHRLRHDALGDRRVARPAGERSRQLTTSYLRLRAYPFTPEVCDFIDKCDRVYVVEQNRDGQMLSLLKMECTSGAVRQAAQHPSLRRAADRRPIGDDGAVEAGTGSVAAKRPVTSEPGQGPARPEAT